MDMEQGFWGLLGPENVLAERRTRTLNVGATVRKFNELAVPGLGAVWFLKQLLLATLGVAVAEQVREKSRRNCSNIEVANAIEALACWLSLNANGWAATSQVRGAQKMQGKKHLTYSTVKKSSFYVTQPMRMATVQGLAALSLVDAESVRFNSFRTSDIGQEFLQLAFAGYRPFKRGVVEALVTWVTGEREEVHSSDDLFQAIAPTVELQKKAKEFIHERLVHGRPEDARRRQNALQAMASLVNSGMSIGATSGAASGGSLNEDSENLFFSDEHWRDIVAGSRFFSIRNKALSVLDRIESTVQDRTSQNIQAGEAALILKEDLLLLKEKARKFIDFAHDPSIALEATQFARECCEADGEQVIGHLVSRDGVGLRFRERMIVPGPAFQGRFAEREESIASADEQGAGVDIQKTMPISREFSYRLRNLFLLNLDLEGKLGDWLRPSEEQSEAAR
jgi:hypothetical protein